MTLSTLQNAAQRGGGIVMLWVESMDDFVQVNKYQLAKYAQENGMGFLNNHHSYRDKDILYIEPCK